MNLYSLDLETKTLVTEFENCYALEPHRFGQGEAVITDCGVFKLSTRDYLNVVQPDHIRAVLNGLNGQLVVAHNTMYDVAVLIASGFEKECSHIVWLDTILLAKWFKRGQRTELMPSWSLAALTEKYLSERSWYDELQFIKKNLPTNGVVEKYNSDELMGESDYWTRRNELDCIATAELAEHLIGGLTGKQRRSMIIEASNILLYAKAWVQGMAQDSQKASERVQPALKVMELVEDKLGLTRKQLSSPKQLCGVIYDDWGWPVNDDLKSKQTGNRSTSKANLVYLTDHDDRALDILHWRSKNTEMTKFLSGAEKCVNYLQSNWMYPVPKIYSTKTGRITYASRTGGKGIMAKASVGVAVHQLPNAGKSDLRTCYPAPPGYTWVNFDAAGQESRLMAHYSRDPTMLNVFKSGLNFHSKTGSLLTNQSYNDFASQLTTGCAEAKEVRRCAKFLNLSNNFRVGLRTARIIARVQHNINASKEEIKYWTSVFHTNYRQIKNYYWPHAIELAKVKGYAETLGGRRFYIDDWSKKESYTSGQDAIAVPIQGSAADMRTCGEMTISKKFPQFNFVLSIHDEIGYYVETKLLGDNNQIVLDARQELNEINYEKLWGETPLVPLLWDASVGVNLGVMKELK